jgi:hypothetical protein
MSGLGIVLAATLVFFIFEILAQTYGVDSRPEFDDHRAPARGIS